tara:strand:- start:1138 stop:1362 length:225 start_codon:yes stop_codon:yes gene_type:complete
MSKEIKDWFGGFLQNQLFTLVAVIFIGGASYQKLNDLSEDAKATQEVVTSIDTRSKINEVEIRHLQKINDKKGN